MIDDEVLEKLERLSMLEISDKKLAKQHLEEILSFIDGLKKIEIQDTSIVDDSYTPLREDVPRQSNVIESVLKHSPSSDGSFFIVPKIIE